ncbi:response regulator [Desulfococcaceae bacterium HSG8]|nr:response regulator [Desulfococcaceae bacterium HSG8]
MPLILVIDDDPQIREVLKKLLETSGYDVVAAADGGEGVKLFYEKSPDLIITDIIMPEKEGIEIIRDLKKKNPEIKIIAMSGGGKYVDSDMCLTVAKKLGAKYVFSKPVKKKELIEAIRELLS